MAEGNVELVKRLVREEPEAIADIIVALPPEAQRKIADCFAFGAPFDPPPHDQLKREAREERARRAQEKRALRESPMTLDEAVDRGLAIPRRGREGR